MKFNELIVKLAVELLIHFYSVVNIIQIKIEYSIGMNIILNLDLILNLL